jgi:hypothetical protein
MVSAFDGFIVLLLRMWHCGSWEFLPDVGPQATRTQPMGVRVTSS